MNFITLYKNTAKNGSTYFKLYVEIASGIWVNAYYYGNTVPKKISKIYPWKDGWKVEIQQHTSRDRLTGKFNGKRKEVHY